MKYIICIPFLAVLGSLGNLSWTTSSAAANSQLECAKKQKLATGGGALAKDEANRFCESADAQLKAAKS